MPAQVEQAERPSEGEFVLDGALGGVKGHGSPWAVLPRRATSTPSSASEGDPPTGDAERFKWYEQRFAFDYV